MRDVVFAFDVEDAVDPASDDAALRLCRVFSEEEVPVSMFIASEKARTLRQRAGTMCWRRWAATRFARTATTGPTSRERVLTTLAHRERLPRLLRRA